MSDDDRTADHRTTIYCRRCGYRLVEIDASSRCPECGTPQALSIGPLRFASLPKHLVSRVHRGLLLVVIGTACIVAATACMTLIRGFRVPNTTLIDAEAILVTVAALHLAGMLLIAVGWLYATPTTLRFHTFRWRPRLTRWSSAAFMAIVVCWLLSYYLSIHMRIGAARPVFYLLSWIGLDSLLFALLASILCLRAFSRWTAQRSAVILTDASSVVCIVHLVILALGIVGTAIRPRPIYQAFSSDATLASYLLVTVAWTAYLVTVLACIVGIRAHRGRRRAIETGGDDADRRESTLE